jgi:hypothetical protein
MTADLACSDERRRQLIRDRKLNGLDYIDVVGTHLCVHFLTGIPEQFLPRKNAVLTPQDKAAAMAHIVIRGGRRVTGIRVIDIDPDEAPSKYEESCLGIELDKEGDWSAYTICFVETRDGQPTDAPLRSLDPRYACLDFTFKIDCPAEVDCATTDECLPEERLAPAISYLAKDYATFRQLILDRLALTMPEWRERHVPDIGIALVELLAYVGDYLAYYQDAVATEQYLDTARQRISVRRHARLVDYAMHEGCNARAFLALLVARDDDTLDPRNLYFITEVATAPTALRQSALELLAPRWLVFEPLTARKTLKLRVAHNAIQLYTWGNEECCLLKGATRATLLDELEDRNVFDPARCDEHPAPPASYGQYGQDRVHGRDGEPDCDPAPEPPPPRLLDLAAGDFLLFEELACAGTASTKTTKNPDGFDGKASQPDADRTHRHVVKITRVTKTCDALRGNRLLEVEWCRQDALPFDLCVSAIGAPPECDLVRGLAVARGNVILVDHGATIRDEPLPTVEPRPDNPLCEGEEAPADVTRTAARYRPRLRLGPLTFGQPPAADACASDVMAQDPRAALPAIVLAAIPPSVDGAAPLFAPAAFAGLDALAQSLREPTRLAALRRRLRPDVVAMIDADKRPDNLLSALEANLRLLMEPWAPRPDLLGSDRDDPDFVAEIDDEGVAHLRFGDGDCGRQIEAGMAFVATYRVGNGRAGRVGPESITHVVYREGFSDVITNIRNPLPSAGAVDPEPIAEVKMFAPGAIRKELGRAITAEDYAQLAQYIRYPKRDPRVQSASGALRWAGSWYEADVAIDAFGTSDLDPSLQTSVEQGLRRYRRMGHDLRVGAAGMVPIRLELDLCVKPEYLRAHVLAAVRNALSSRTLRGGRRGFFHPDNLTFGEAVYASRIIAAVMAVDGVAEVHVVRLERLAHARRPRPRHPIELLPLGSNEIARLDNDPALPENGILSFRRVRGGQ